MIATMERARSLRGIADRRRCTEDEAAMLRELADEQQERAEYDAWVRAEVQEALAEPQPGYTTQQAREYVLGRLREKYGHAAERGREPAQRVAV